MDAIIYAAVESFVLGQRGGCLASIADLASVPTSHLTLVLGKMVLCEFQDLVFIDLHCATLTLRELFEIGGPDLHRLVKFKRWIVKLCVNPRHKCFVQDANTVGSQEQNTSVELEDAQED